jgi:predicted AAA+ superfamily ATPase
MPQYVPRGLESRLIEAVGTSPVAVLEGPRAVGKTRMCQELVSQGHLATCVSLTDPNTRVQVRRDLRGWLRSLPTPAVIDEAQLVPELPLAVKEVVDGRGASGQFVLTGSSSIGRTGLGGTDPLAGRYVRLGMRPMTQVELACEGLPGGLPRRSVVDELIEGDFPAARTVPEAERADIIRRMRLGGFPRYATERGPVRAQLQLQRISADIEATLADGGFGREKFDVYLARRVLDAVVSVPGGVLNMSALGDRLELDRRTVDRYVEILKSRFLVYQLPNLAARPRVQGVAHPKVHPIDVAVAAAVLDGTGRQIDQRPEIFGELLESLVVNELVAQAAWSSCPVQPYYWRNARSRGDEEVDLVLVDAAKRSVGVEVKASRSVGPRDAAGLRALRSRFGLFRGFVVYAGGDIFEIEESIWALPVSFLYGVDLWSPGADRAKVAVRAGEGMGRVADVGSGVLEAATGDLLDVPDAAVFASYVYSDDRSEDGAIVRFVNDLADRYQFLFGGTIQVFLDKHDVTLGEEWERRLTQELEQTTFLLAIVTPRFLRSEACRAEVVRFSAHARSMREPRLLLPLVWRKPRELDEAPADDPVTAALRAAQWEDAGDELRYPDPSSGTYRRRLDQLAERLHHTVVAVERRAASRAGLDPSRADGGGALAGDLLADFGQFEELADAFPAELDKLRAQVAGMSGVMTALGSPPQEPSARSARAWANRAAQALAAPAEGLNEALESTRGAWSELDVVISRVVSSISDEPALSGLPGAAEFLAQVRDLPATLDGFAAGVDEMLGMLAVLARMSRQLRPFAGAVQAAVSLFVEMRAAAQAWAAATHVGK